MTLNKILSQFSKMNKELTKFMERKEALIASNDKAITNYGKTISELHDDSSDHHAEIERAVAVQANIKVLIGDPT